MYLLDWIKALGNQQSRDRQNINNDELKHAGKHKTSKMGKNCVVLVLVLVDTKQGSQ